MSLCVDHRVLITTNQTLGFQNVKPGEEEELTSQPERV